MSKRQILKLAMLIIVLILNSLNPVNALSGQTPDIQAEFNSELLEERLNSQEIESVQDALEKALRDNELVEEFGFSSDDILEDALKGKPLNNLEGLPKVVLSILGKEIRANVGVILQLFSVMLLGAVIRALQPANGGIPAEAAKIGVNGVIIILASVSFGNIVNIVTTTIESMQNLASIALPALFALLASTGRIVSVTAIQPLMLFGVNVACQVCKTVLLPMAIMAGILFLIDSVSERFKLKTLAKLLKSSTIWITGAITMIFSIAVSIQKLASGSIDAVTLKTAKFAIGTFVPVAGKYMADAAETILLCTSAASNAAGILTVIGLGFIIAVPFIKVFIIMISLRLAAAFGAPICDESICDALEDSSSCLTVILGIMGAVLFLLVLLTGTLMSSGGIML